MFKIILISSANKIIEHLLENKCKSFINNINNIGLELNPEELHN